MHAIGLIAPAHGIRRPGQRAKVKRVEEGVEGGLRYKVQRKESIEDCNLVDETEKRSVDARFGFLSSGRPPSINEN